VRLGQKVQALPRRLAASQRLSLGDTPAIIHVVAGVLINAAGHVLIAQRPTGKHLAGGWEFPGGKLEPGEERLAGLKRELREEIGITLDTPRPLIRVRHTYSYGEVLLDVWVVRRYAGEPRGLDGQALRWCTQDELAAAPLLPADRPIVAALRLPERLRQVSSAEYEIHDSGWRPLPAVTEAGDMRLHGVLCTNAEQMTAAAEAGANFLALCEPLAADELTALCRSIFVPVYARGLALEEAWALGASGINDLDL